MLDCGLKSLLEELYFFTYELNMRNLIKISPKYTRSIFHSDVHALTPPSPFLPFLKSQHPTSPRHHTAHQNPSKFGGALSQDEIKSRETINPHKHLGSLSRKSTPVTDCGSKGKRKFLDGAK